MNFGIIGAGPAGIFSALMIKGHNPEHTVTIYDGNQKIGDGVYGKSITDACLGWEKTERLIYNIAESL